MTAVEFLAEKIKKYDVLYFLMCLWFDEAKEMEKQQIIDAYYKGIQEQTQRGLFKNPEITEPEQYYNKTFNKT